MSKETKLKELFEQSMTNGGPAEFRKNWEQSIGIVTDEDGNRKFDKDKREVDYKDFEIGRVCTALLGNRWQKTFEQHWVNASRMRFEGQGSSVVTGNLPYVTSALDVIAGLANARALERPTRPEFIWDSMCTVKEASGEGGFDIIVRPAGDKPSTDLTDVQAIPTVMLKGSRVHRNRTKNQGLRTKINLYTILDDLTGTLYDAIDENSDQVLNERERKVADCLMGIGNTDGTGITLTRDGMSFYPYQTSASTAVSPENGAQLRNYVNAATSLGPVNYTAVESAFALLYGIRDPFTGLPNALDQNDITVLIAPRSRLQWENNLLASEVWNIGSIGLTTAYSKNTVSPNPLSKFKFNLVWSQIWYNRAIDVGFGGTKYTNASGDSYTTANSIAGLWYMGHPKKAVSYWQRQPYTVQQVPLSSMEYAEQTVLVQDVIERGDAYWHNAYQMFQGQA
jgi:hypothetical protein